MQRRLLLVCALLALGVGAAACGSDVDTRLEALREAIAAGRGAEAVEPLRALVEAHPERADAQHLLGVAYLQTGQVSLAIWPLEKAAEDPGYAPASNAALAPAYLALENFDGAVEAASQALAQDPSQTPLLATRSRAHLGAGRGEPALTDAEALLAASPDHYEGLLLRAAALAALERGEEAEQAYRRLREATRQDPQFAAHGCLALATFHEESGEPARAEAAIEECLAASPDDLLTLQLATELHDRRGQPERAEQIISEALERAPDNLGLRAALARRLLSRGDSDAAEGLVREATERWPESAEVWQLQSQLDRQLGRPREASRALDRMLETLPEDADREAVLFEQADLAIDAGDLTAAETLAAGIERAEYRELVRGRILLEQGRAADSLAAFETGTRLWPNNAYARYLAGVAAHRAGDREKAIKHLREATRARADATDAAYELALLYLEDGLYEDASAMVARHLESRGSHAAEALRVGARAAIGLGRNEQALSALERAAALGIDAQRIALDRAAVYRVVEGSAGAARSLSNAGLDLAAAENSAALQMLIEDLLGADDPDEAGKWLERAIARQGETARLLALRGRLAQARGDREAARLAFRAALDAEPEQSSARIGLADLAREQGETERALALYDAAGETDIAGAYRAAQLLLATDRRDEAETRLRDVVRREPGHVFACNDLAWLLAEQGSDFETALELASRAVRLRPDAITLDTRAWVQLKAGRPEAAAVSFRQALEREPENPTLWYHLALARLAQDDAAAAREALENALARGPFPEMDAARSALAELGPSEAG